ncbi:MAG TPA: class I SAM-dependent methyltransferase [Planctomycetaceae bacterium]|nr:class I SAM-dependent methyltransferase [Planctomycetaceae bacterium]
MAVGKGRCVGPPALSRPPIHAIHCVLCGYAHLDPKPNPDTLSALYRYRYYSDLYPNWLRKEWQERRWLFATARYRLALLARLSPPGRDLLDVGCSWGWLVAEARRQGWEARGYDPSDAALTFARVHLGLDLLPAADLGQHPNSVSVLTAFLLLEHLPDPASFFSAAFRDLRPGGLLAVLVPNEFNPLQLALNARGYSPIDPLHVNYFTPESLDRLARAAGFVPVWHEATFPVELLALLGLDYVTYPALGRVVHAVRKVWESIAYALFPAQLSRARAALLRRFGWGREVLAVYRKPRLAPERLTAPDSSSVSLAEVS